MTTARDGRCPGAAPDETAPNTDGRLTRRSMLVTGAATAGLATLTLAGCGSAPSQAPSAGPGANAPAGPPPAAAGSAAPASPPPAAAPSAAEAPATALAAPAGTRLVALAGIPVGQSVSATGAGGQKLIVTRTGPDSAVAHSAICTHMGCTVAPAGARLNCPCHGSVYTAATGAVVHGPASAPLAAVAVTVSNGQVVQP
ncbi:ubiquinol-cytochrome c reductase iron-sulfur subunit [Pseudonocardia acidicola]|nr:Rieske (2Fe-2S) protein [Pseudonocardia acidicola]